MAEKVKRISINALEKYINEHTPQLVITDSIGDMDITIKHFLSISEMMTFVDQVTEFCFSEDGSYLPELKDFMIKSSILEKYANFSLPSNLTKRYEFICRSGEIVDFILERIDKNQFFRMIDAIDEKIDKKASSNINETTRRINDLFSSVEKFEDEFKDIFTGVDKGDLANFLSAMADGKFDAQKVVEAYMSVSGKQNVGDNG